PSLNRLKSEPRSPHGRSLDGLMRSVPTSINFANATRASSKAERPNGWSGDRYEQSPGQMDRIWILDVTASASWSTPGSCRRPVDRIAPECRASFRRVPYPDVTLHGLVVEDRRAWRVFPRS